MRAGVFADELNPIVELSHRFSPEERLVFLDSMPQILRLQPNVQVGEIVNLMDNYSRDAKCSVSELVEHLKQIYTPALVPPGQIVRNTVVDEYVKGLTAALGNDREFLKLHAKLSQARTVNKKEANLISKLFFGKPGDTKTKALSNILKRHKDLLHGKDENRASGGRIAA